MISEDQNFIGQKLKKLFSNPVFILTVYALIAIIVSLQEYLLSKPDDAYTHYNNFIIFRQSFIHLIQGKDLYIAHPEVQNDLFKYSPSFAVLMFPFALIPPLAGLIFWNLLNAIVFFYAIKSLPVNDPGIRRGIWWFVVVELITSLQNSQSNALIAGLLILSFCLLERRKILLATLLISLTVFIKIFGVFAFSLLLLYPDKKRFFLFSVLWMVALTFLPLIVISPSQLTFLYQSWLHLLAIDYNGSAGLSVMGWLHSWFHFDPPKNMITLAGILFLCLPLLFIKRYNGFIFRWLFLSGILIWVIIFNHKAESATFIIAVSGVALWYFSQEKNLLNTTLVILVFVFTCLSPTDLFPLGVRKNFFVPYTLKAIPCIIIWIKIIAELTTASYKPKPSLN